MTQPFQFEVFTQEKIKHVSIQGYISVSIGYINLLLLHDKRPNFSSLKTTYTYLSFHESGVQSWLSWMLRISQSCNQGVGHAAVLSGTQAFSLTHMVVDRFNFSWL